MKPTVQQIRLLPLGLVAAIALFHGSVNQPRTDWPTAPAVSTATLPQPAPFPDESGGLAATAVTSYEQLAAPHAMIRAKLRQLAEAETGDTDTPSRLLKDLLVMLTDDNAAGIVRSLSAEELGTPFGIAALEHWLGVDPLAAANWIAARPDVTEEQALVVARKLLADRAILHAYCDALPDGNWKQQVLAGAGLDLLSKDPAGAIALAQRMSPGDARTNLFETVAYDWTSRDPDAALAWIMQVEDPGLRERLSAVGLKAVALTDPDLAAKWLGAVVQSEPILSETTLCLVEAWGTREPAKAASWVALLPAPGPREGAVDSLLRHWLDADVDAAIAWIETLPEREKILAKLQAEAVEDEPGI